MNNTIHIHYSIRFDSPFHLGTGMRQGLIDRGVMRDSAGYLYIPGSTIKGILREKCEQIALSPAFTSEQLTRVQSPHIENLRSFAKTPTIVDRIFGSRFQEGTVYFDNAVMADSPTGKDALGKDFLRGASDTESQPPTRAPDFQHLQVEIRAQNSISRRTGTAVEYALFRSEYGIRHLTFSGEIYGNIHDTAIEGQKVTYAVVLLAAGLRLFERIGANKSTGMGKFSFLLPQDTIQVDTQHRPLDELIELLEQLDAYTIRQEGGS